MKDRFKLRVDLSFIYIVEVLWFLYEEIREKMDSLALQMTEYGIAKNKTTDLVEMNKYNLEMNRLSGQIKVLKWVLGEQKEKNEK